MCQGHRTQRLQNHCSWSLNFFQSQSRILKPGSHSLTKTRIYHSIPLKEIASHLTPITTNGDDDDDDKINYNDNNDDDDYDDHVDHVNNINNDDDDNSEDNDDDNSHVYNVIEALLFY